MKKHKFNIFPEAKPDDFNRLMDDIKTNGYDRKQPVTMYQGEVLDGWNRVNACRQLGITPATVEFAGSDADAIAFVMRTNKRRNLNSGQWATIAVEADEVMAAIREAVEKEAELKRVKNAANQHQPRDKKLSAPSDHLGGCKDIHEYMNKTRTSSSEHAAKTATKAASLFNTNRTYINQAAKMKEKAPEVFEKVKAGKMTMQDGNKAVRAIPTSPWLPDEEERKALVVAGQSVVANAERDKNLIQWAEKKGVAVRVDRSSKYGNPFILGDDGDRDKVCDSYANHYLPHKPSITEKLKGMRGKVLICHCYPNRCHANAIIDYINKATG